MSKKPQKPTELETTGANYQETLRQNVDLIRKNVDLQRELHGTLNELVRERRIVHALLELADRSQAKW